MMPRNLMDLSSDLGMPSRARIENLANPGTFRELDCRFNLQISLNFGELRLGDHDDNPITLCSNAQGDPFGHPKDGVM